MKLGTNPRDDVVALLWGEVGGQGLDGLDVVVRLHPRVRRIRGRNQLQDGSGLISHDLEVGTWVGGLVPPTQRLEDGDPG